MKKNVHLLCSAYLKLVFIAVFVFFYTQTHADVHYVKTGSAGTAPYTSWATASNDLQAVINAASTGDEIWIATGTYKPNRRADALTVITATDRNNAFVLKNNVKIYGGFTGVEILLSQRNSIANGVTLSGDINTLGVTTDNCFHVVISSGNNNATLLDGVQVASGNANGSSITTVTVNTRLVVANRGGGIYSVASSAVFDDCTIRRNNTAGNGAGIYDTLIAAIAINNCTIVQNLASNNGGGIYNTGSSPDIYNCDITQNDAGNHGGGIYNTGSSPGISSCGIEQNSALNNGGGIYNTSSSPVLTGNSIVDNEAGNNGGGIYNTASSNNITAGSIIGNIASNNGGGLYNTTSSEGSIANIKILSNTAVRGGGIYNSNSSPLVSGSALHSNVVSASGGAVYNLNADAVEFDQCTFNSNTAVTDGGAIYFNGGTAPELKNCSFRGNSGVLFGGGIYIFSSDVLFINCLFSGNLAGSGGGIYVGASVPVFINCTVVANRATSGAGGILITLGTSIILRNSILWSNTATSGNNFTGGGTITASYSNIEGGAAGAGNINAASLFTAPELASAAPTTAGNYRVQKCSPVINAGSNGLIPSGITVDIIGDDRINYAVVDMGAYEKTLAVKAPSGIVYVDHTKNGDGSEWNKAIPSLADALLTAKYNASITQIWVAKGTYYPEYNATNLASLVCNPANRYNSFVLVNNVKVYGGFINGAASLAERDAENNTTILDGDINGDNTSSGNTYHVVISANAVGTATLDGFTITGGNADYSGNTVTVNGITITSFYGGGMGISLSSPTISDCILEGNHGDHGGAVSVLSGSPVFNRCIIKNNTARLFGGAIDHWVIGPASGAVLNNCLVTGNKSSQYGGAFVSTSPSVLTINNCTVAGNFADMEGGGLWSNGTAMEVIKNSILWGNRVGAAVSNIRTNTGTVNTSYSNIEGGYAGTGNINLDPLFINPQPASAAPTPAGNYRLQKCSPAVNAGSNALIPGGVFKDLDSNNRIAFITVDMGAYEKRFAVPGKNGIVYVNSANMQNEGDGSSWAKAVRELSDALEEADVNTDVKEIWVAKGTYKPLYNAEDSYTSVLCNPAATRDNSFVLAADVKIYGGFGGGETDTSGRDFVSNETILSGDIGVANDTADNCYHVAISAGNIGSAVLDGFSVTKGIATASFASASIIVNAVLIPRSTGGGLKIRTSSPFLKHCSFYSNIARGGGAIAHDLGGKTTISESSFISNMSIETSNGGGGIIALDSIQINKCLFKANYAGLLGGAIFTLSSSSHASITNSIFSGNKAKYGGGIALASNTGSSISSCTIAGNNAETQGGGLYTGNNSVFNSIIWNNQAGTSEDGIFGSGNTISYSISQDGYAGTGNYNIDPLFVSPHSPAAAPTIEGDYHLQACSPAINMGENSLIPPGLTKDLDSLDRIKYTTVDLGAYEMQTINLATTTWKGFNTNWNDKINWCGGYIPYDTTNVTVPATSNNPVINAGYGNEVKNIVLANATSLTVANTGSFTINGTYTNNGSTITNNGTWVMAGNAGSQTFPGSLATVSAMNNLEVNNPSGLKFDKSFQLTGTLTPTDGNIDIDNATITLNSDATSTARVAAIPSTVAFSYTGTGKFEVERYILPHRAWRLLTAPLSTATNLTISQAWQEGLSNSNRLSPVIGTTGFGTTITKSTTYSAADGYDQGSTNSASIRYYNGTNWGGVPTKTNGITVGANDGLINDKQGYMLFVRGDRGIVVAGTGVAATVTTLRPKGQIKTGPQTIVCNGWTVIGNPYASPINFHKIVLDNPGLSDAFYVWDANLAGSSNVGGWVSYGSYNAGTQTYTVAPLVTGSSFANNKGDISSGSAFMVNYTGTITINENCKSTLGDNVLYRPSRQLSINLYVVNADSTESLNDGLVIKMDASTGAANAEKNTNFSENLAIAFANKRYAIQNRQRPHFNDTVFIYTGQMKQRNYVLEIKADELNMPNSMKAFLEDTYLHRYQPVALEGSTRHSFTVNADSGSMSAARFRLLFKKAAKFKYIHAAVKEKDIEVLWEMEENFGLEKYEIERSINGLDFTVIGNQLTNKNQQPLMQNQWLDVSPDIGNFYYRIKAIGLDGEIMYSDIAKVSLVKNKAGMFVYPNPVTGHTLQLRMNKQTPGAYIATLTNSNGQKILTQQWQHGGGFETKIFILPAMIATGLYQLEIIQPTGAKEAMVVEVQR